MVASFIKLHHYRFSLQFDPPSARML